MKVANGILSIQLKEETCVAIPVACGSSGIDDIDSCVLKIDLLETIATCKNFNNIETAAAMTPGQSAIPLSFNDWWPLAERHAMPLLKCNELESDRSEVSHGSQPIVPPIDGAPISGNVQNHAFVSGNVEAVDERIMASFSGTVDDSVCGELGPMAHVDGSQHLGGRRLTTDAFADVGCNGIGCNVIRTRLAGTHRAIWHAFGLWKIVVCALFMSVRRTTHATAVPSLANRIVPNRCSCIQVWLGRDETASFSGKADVPDPAYWPLAHLALLPLYKVRGRHSPSLCAWICRLMHSCRADPCTVSCGHRSIISLTASSPARSWCTTRWVGCYFLA